MNMEGLVMIEIISGEKGKGKTKLLLEKVNQSAKETAGSIVYLDKNGKHMYELDQKIRLVDVSQCFITNCNEFLGFVSGILSSNSDILEVYLDSFLTMASIKEDELEMSLVRLEELSLAFNVKFIISLSMNSENLPKSLEKYSIIAL